MPAIPRVFLRLASAIAVASVLSQCGGPSEPERRPDIILIVVDTLRADAILDPNGLVDTPNIDQLAADGVVFPKAFSHAPMTLPSHTALFAGRPPVDTGVFNNGQIVPEDVPLLPEWLQRYGYATQAAISLGTLTPIKGQGLNRGFDEYRADFWQIITADKVAPRISAAIEALDADQPSFLFAHYCDPHEPYNAHGTVQREAKVVLDNDREWTIPTSELRPIEEHIELTEGPHVIEATSDHLFRISSVQLHTDGGKRVQTTSEPDTRTPSESFRIQFDAPKDGRYRLRMRVNEKLTPAEIRQRYLLEVEYADRYVGQLLDELRRTGRYDSSLIIFTSDHGEALGEHGTIGHVQNLHDEMLHVPLIIKPPKGSAGKKLLEKGRGRVAAQANIVPTILELVGVPAMPQQRGSSLLSDKRPPLLAQTHTPEAKRNLISFRDERFKLIHDIDQDTFELYDLETDPKELSNIYDEADKTHEEWKALLRRLGETSIKGTRGEASGTLADDLEALGY